MPNLGGRPSIYTPELAKQICEYLASGLSLRKTCEQPGMPERHTVMRWALNNHEGFYTQYEAARTVAYELMVDELNDIADDGTNDYMKRADGIEALNAEHVQRSRLRLDTRKWIVSRVLPKFRDTKHLDVTTNGEKITKGITVVAPDKEDEPGEDS